MKSSLIISFVLGLFIISCHPAVDNSTVHSAQAVVDSAISRGNYHLLANAELTFDFRDRTYGYKRSANKFEYTRLFIDSTGVETRDVLNNDGLKRYINGLEQQPTDKKRNAYTNSVNSVIYFAFLPYRLNDEAANKTYLGTFKILGKLYHKIMVTFSQEGGGEDFDDVFIYWFDTKDYRMDYLAYEYQTNDGGIRFRKATNPRSVDGILIQDYINYKPIMEDPFPLTDIDQQFEQGKLEMLSTIVLKNIAVSKSK